MDTIGPYRVLETVQGGRRPFYVVAGKDGSKLAMKTAPLAGLSAEERERFQREAAVCATLDHPNLVRVLDSGETAEVLYQVMEYLEGADFSQVLASGRTFSWEQKLSIMDAVCDGLQYAHARGLVHRDIKPANLFLENSGRVRLLDFGMVRMASSALTRVGASVGTLNYMAPEQIRGETCSSSTDVFAAGIVFYRLGASQHPFSVGKKSLPEILSAILFESPPAWSGVAPPGAPQGLEFVIRRALEKDPLKRWQSAGELRQALSLCRFTLEHAPAAESPPARADLAKTRVVRRTPVAPVPAPRPEPAPARPAPPPRPAPQARFCPSCTHANSPHAVVCARCGTPLVAPAAAPATDGPPPLLLWVLIGAVVVLVAVVVILLITLR